MYDQSTLELMHNAPVFGNLNLDRLPQELTDGYTQIVGARLRFQELANIEIEQQEGLEELLEHVRKIAFSYEAYLALLSNESSGKSAAFIAASAHKLAFQIEQFLYPGARESQKLISTSGISSEISAGILFVASGYTADAMEIARQWEFLVDETAEGMLTDVVYQLVSGEINTDTTLPFPPSFLEWDESDAANALWAEIHKGINIILSALSGNDSNVESSFENAKEIFQKIKKLSVDRTQVSIGDFSSTIHSTFTGQRHLSALLEAAMESIQSASISSIQTPTDLDGNLWARALKGFAAKRPYLWPNHVQAIENGLLEPGSSAVISFPTGGGKSTLAELKIATALQQGKSVLFIAPTLALVDQVAKSLSEAFPTVTTKLSIEEFDLHDLEIESIPDISVMTPESCLVRMSFSPELFENVGLFIFDECHLLHSKNSDFIDRRSIDSMLCLLRIIELSPTLDLLLMSAMISNSGELAGWLNSILNRPVLNLDYSWKPTRQAKGSIVYDSDELKDIEKFIERNADRTSTGRLTAPAKRNLLAIPYAFFSLNQTWHSNDIVDYRQVQLLNEQVQLQINDSDRLTPNRNKVAAILAVSSAKSGLKTLIFSSTKKECDSIASNTQKEFGDHVLNFTPQEHDLLSLINIEMGSTNLTYATPESSCLPHHGLLLREERALHESLFKRNDGVSILVATSTLAQGINLPAECVIIAGNTRFDTETDKQEEIDAHELLNAAGRAGRAGQTASGIVLVIPSKVIRFNSQSSRITNYWGEIQSVFSQADQCLTVEDPLELILDKIHSNSEVEGSDSIYFLKRLSSDDPEFTTNYIKKTFGAYKHQVSQDLNWIDERIRAVDQAIGSFDDDSELHNEIPWLKQLASTSGVSLAAIEELHEYVSNEVTHSDGCIELISGLVSWVCSDYRRFDSFIRTDMLNQELKRPYSHYGRQEQLKYIKNEVLTTILMWMIGTPLKEIDVWLTSSQPRTQKCERARRFSIRVVPEFSFLAGLASQIYMHIHNSSDSLSIKMLGQCIRSGFDSPGKYALHQILKEKTVRVATHQKFSQLVPHLDDGYENGEFGDLMSYIGSVFRDLEE